MWITEAGLSSLLHSSPVMVVTWPPSLTINIISSLSFNDDSGFSMQPKLVHGSPSTSLHLPRKIQQNFFPIFFHIAKLADWKLGARIFLTLREELPQNKTNMGNSRPKWQTPIDTQRYVASFESMNQTMPGFPWTSELLKPINHSLFLSSLSSVFVDFF